jgi:DNA-binding GntR family transcriptional regulator
MIEHRAILAALRARDVEEAVRTSNEHDRLSAEEIIEQLRRNEAARTAV